MKWWPGSSQDRRHGDRRKGDRRSRGSLDEHETQRVEVKDQVKAAQDSFRHVLEGMRESNG